MVIKSIKRALREARRKNEALAAELAKAREKTEFLALLTADIDIDKLMEEVPENEAQ